MDYINLLSDTVTRPTSGMLSAMMAAMVGDDVFKDDPTINRLQEKAAGLFGKKAALFCPSGTMSNQIAIKLHTQPAQQVICSSSAHINVFEGGGIGFNSLCTTALINNHDGMFSAVEAEKAINNRDNIHLSTTALISLENTTNIGGGKCWDINKIAEIREVAQKYKLPMHLDGARLFNAMVATGTKPENYGRLFDTISVCLSKGLGAPVGSVLIGGEEHIEKALRWRKVFGGGMRQAGYLAAAGIYALENNVERLEEDHRRARVLADALKTKDYVDELIYPETNIVIFSLRGISCGEFQSRMKSSGVLCSNSGPERIRMVTHLDFNDRQLKKVLGLL